MRSRGSCVCPLPPVAPPRLPTRLGLMVVTPPHTYICVTVIHHRATSPTLPGLPDKSSSHLFHCCLEISHNSSLWIARWCPQDGSTALIEASYKGHSQVVKELAAAGADVNAKTNVGGGGGGYMVFC